MRTLIIAFCALTLPASAQATGFQSPSGNLHCFLDEDFGPYARCDITHVERTPHTPAYCDLDYGQAFGVDERSRGEALCVGDTVKDDRNPVLNYGSSISQGGITCRSQEAGMSCENERGHGFTLSRKTQRVY